MENAFIAKSLKVSPVPNEHSLFCCLFTDFIYSSSVPKTSSTKYFLEAFYSHFPSKACRVYVFPQILYYSFLEEIVYLLFP
jgi:hypothetical protein